MSIKYLYIVVHNLAILKQLTQHIRVKYTPYTPATNRVRLVSKSVDIQETVSTAILTTLKNLDDYQAGPQPDQDPQKL